MLRAAKILIALLAAALLLAATGAAAKDWPRPTGPVADYANVIPGQYRQKIAALMTELYQKTGDAVVVATIPDLGGQTIEQAAVSLFEKWGIGSKAKDNGVLILVALAERKLRIEVGYGLEGLITDAKAGQVRDEFLVPFLRKNRFGEGLYAGSAAVAAIIAQDRGVTLTGMPKLPKSGPGKGAGMMVIFALLFAGWAVLSMARRGRGGRGGMGGVLPWLLIGSMMGSGGRDYGGGGGGFGGFGGGGFGGFGGGISGGGGASGGF